MNRSTTLILCVLIVGCGSRTSDARKDNAAPAHAVDAIHLSKGQLANASLAYAVAEERQEIGTLEATAQIEPAPDRVAKIAARVPGRVVAVNVSVGEQVLKGQTLAVLDAPEIGQAKADYLSALATATLARTTATREHQLFDRRVSAEREWREAEAEATRAEAAKDAAENRLHALGIEDQELGAIRTERHYSATMQMRTPIDGVVAERDAVAGQIVEPMNGFLTIMDLRVVWTVVDVYEQNIPQVRVGQRVTVTTTAYPDSVFTGTVAAIGAVIEQASRSVKVRIALPNPRRQLMPGMFATVRFQGTYRTAAKWIYVPEAAVQRESERSVVFIPDGEGVFRVREIKTGPSASGWVLVKEGLAAGERVVTTGAFLLKSELRKGELGEGGEND